MDRVNQVKIIIRRVNQVKIIIRTKAIDLRTQVIFLNTQKSWTGDILNSGMPRKADLNHLTLLVDGVDVRARSVRVDLSGVFAWLAHRVNDTCEDRVMVNNRTSIHTAASKYK